MRNVWKSGFEKIFARVFLRYYSADWAEIWRAPIAYFILFSLKLILGLGFHDDLNFVNNVTSSHQKILYLVLHNEIDVQERLGSNLEKIHEAFRFY